MCELTVFVYDKLTALKWRLERSNLNPTCVADGLHYPFWDVISLLERKREKSRGRVWWIRQEQMQEG